MEMTQHNYSIRKSIFAQFKISQWVSIGFILVFAVTHSNAMVQKDEHSEDQNVDWLQTKDISPCSLLECNLVNCKINCVNVAENVDLTTIIETELQVFPPGVIIIDDLIINGFLIEGGILAENWINTTRFQMIRLTLIIPEEIEDIKGYTFKGFPFEKLKGLYLHFATIEVLEASTFDGLSNLEELLMTTCSIKQINERALEAVAPTLKYFTLNYMRFAFNPVNLTGSIPLPNLIDVQLNYNIFNDFILSEKSFSQLVKCENISFMFSSIMFITCGTFENMTLLKGIDFYGNFLTHLDSCVFGNEIINKFEENSIRVAGNPWYCTCELNWLKQLKIEKIIWGDAICVSPSFKPFEDIDFCPEEPFENDLRT